MPGSYFLYQGRTFMPRSYLKQIVRLNNGSSRMDLKSLLLLNHIAQFNSLEHYLNPNRASKFGMGWPEQLDSEM
jgi:hypothetical protein